MSMESTMPREATVSSGPAIPRKVTEVLSREEIKRFTEASNLHGARAVLGSWALIVLSFVALAFFPHPLTVIAALVIIGGQQLAIAVLMHEAAHRILFRSRALNDFAGHWLCGKPVWATLERYRTHHLGHHARTGALDDPDRSLIQGFPITRRSLGRKLIRDLSGLTGLKRLYGLTLIDAELIRFTVAGDVERLPRRPPRVHLGALIRHAGGTALTNAILLGALAAAGHAWIYLVWLGAYLTTYSLFMRIRSIAEHACTADSENPFENTRSTRAGLLARFTVAPHQVNYHLEHHLLPTVPWFRLPALRRLLQERGVVARLRETPSYLDVLRLASARAA